MLQYIMLVSSPFLNTVYQYGQVVMWGYWMTFLILKNYVHDLSSIVLLRLEPYLQQMFDFVWSILQSTSKKLQFCLTRIVYYSQIVKYTFFNKRSVYQSFNGSLLTLISYFFSKEKFCVLAHIGKSFAKCLLSEALWSKMIYP